VRGSISLAARDALDALLRDYADRLAYLRQDLSDLRARTEESDLSRLRAEGLLGDALDRLRESGDESAMDAIRLLYRLHREAADAAS
jgi:hypothetical protein